MFLDLDPQTTVNTLNCDISYYRTTKVCFEYQGRYFFKKATIEKFHETYESSIYTLYFNPLNHVVE